jgi:hypothetical protein
MSLKSLVIESLGHWVIEVIEVIEVIGSLSHWVIGSWLLHKLAIVLMTTDSMTIDLLTQ